MKALKAYLTVNVVIAMLSGLVFLFFPVQFTAGQGTNLSPAGLIFVRTIGGLILSVAVLDWYARNLHEHKMMEGVLLTNLLLHLISATVDITGISRGIIHGSTE